MPLPLALPRERVRVAVAGMLATTTPVPLRESIWKVWPEVALPDAQPWPPAALPSSIVPLRRMSALGMVALVPLLPIARPLPVAGRGAGGAVDDQLPLKLVDLLRRFEADAGRVGVDGHGAAAQQSAVEVEAGGAGAAGVEVDRRGGGAATRTDA